MKKFLLGLAACIFAVASRATEWGTDLDAAKKVAAAGKKNILVMFCDRKNASALLDKRLDAEFRDLASPIYVLVKIENASAQVLENFGVEDYPTLATLDKEGRPYGEVSGFYDVDKVLYLKQLVAFDRLKAKRDLLFAMADLPEKQAEKAKLLNEALLLLTQVGLFNNGSACGYEAIIKQIIELDNDNALHLRAVWDLYLASGLCRRLENAGQPLAGLHALDVFIASYPGEKRMVQRAFFMKAQVYRRMNDKKGYMTAITAARDIDPTSEMGSAAAEIIKNETK